LESRASSARTLLQEIDSQGVGLVPLNVLQIDRRFGLLPAA